MRKFLKGLPFPNPVPFLNGDERFANGTSLWTGTNKQWGQAESKCLGILGSKCTFVNEIVRDVMYGISRDTRVNSGFLYSSLT